jgi:hypothetical protein
MRYEMKKYTPPIFSPEDLRKKYNDYLSLPIRDKLKMCRTLAAQTCAMLRNGNHTLENLEFYEKTLKEYIKYISSPEGYNVELSQIALARLKLLGIAEPKIITKKNFIISTDIASFTIRDANSNSYSLSETKEQILSGMNMGEYYTFSAAADGVYSMQLRLVDGPEPILASKEYKRVEVSSSEAIIQIPSGLVAVSDGSGIVESQSLACEMTMKVPPGFYKIRVFVLIFPNDDSSYYIVFAPTDKLSQNALTDIETLEA